MPSRETIQLLIALAVFSATCSAVQSLASKPSDEDALPSPIKVFKAGKQVSAPELIPMDLSASIVSACHDPISGDVDVAIIVDPEGNPNDILLNGPSGNTLDLLAVEMAARDRFKPGERDGIPVAVSITVKMHLQACVADIAGKDGKTIPKLRLRSQPVQRVGSASSHEPSTLVVRPLQVYGSGETTPLEKIGGRISQPIPISTPAASFSAEARSKGIQGVVLLRLIVNAQGIPQNIQVVRPLGHGLDEAAVDAVKRYRFRPAMKDGNQPVPVMLTIEVNFRLG